ncbi:hypothetical protein VFPFJ_07498 [Purpureocillium lilacinum]|uniref:Uncharacterized protein n=1 Tax=Purpureocillium lilacinum TaxID=33203 RepID=A0A179HHS5_PURLI|nr:hypothetical protein VFPFJ_07498 [Purpureocillium lilacinum]OAQ89033.1 hypothetical protein VFPFJ_07498 [Purpureocillium lilacinum]
MVELFRQAQSIRHFASGGRRRYQAPAKARQSCCCVRCKPGDRVKKGCLRSGTPNRQLCHKRMSRTFI